MRLPRHLQLEGAATAKGPARSRSVQWTLSGGPASGSSEDSQTRPTQKPRRREKPLAGNNALGVEPRSFFPGHPNFIDKGWCYVYAAQLDP